MKEIVSNSLATRNIAQTDFNLKKKPLSEAVSKLIQEVGHLLFKAQSESENRK